jgi:phenylacetate-CoA ligase
LRAWQERKLRHLIEHAYDKVPYYRELLRSRGLDPEDIRTIEDLQKLPPISKDEIRRHYPLFIAKDLDRRRALSRSTGGTTGKPLQYYQDVDAWSLGNACVWRGWSYAGYDPGDKIATLAGSSLVPDEKPPLRKRLFWLLQRNLHLSAAHLSEEVMDSYAKSLMRFGPRFIRGYPTALYLIAQHLRSAGVDSIHPRAVFTTAEMLTPAHRETIEEVFGCQVYDGYGCGDGGGNAMECSEHCGHHFAAERAVLEIVRDGSLCPKGETGEFLLTDLHNLAMPFIRYRVGDSGAWSLASCQCGRGLPLLARLEGRATDLMTFEGGVSLSGPATTLIFQRTHFKQYQVVQRSKTHLLVRVVPGNAGLDTDAQDRAHVLRTLRYHLGTRIQIEWHYVARIPLAPSGKLRFFISEKETRSIDAEDGAVSG